MNELIAANDSNFEILLNDNKSAIIVDFSSPTCGPCRLLEPSLKKIASDHYGQVKILKINVNESPRTSSRFFVRSVPTLLFVKNGSVMSQITGASPKAQIEAKLREIL